MSVNSKMTAIADEIRAKTGKTAELTLDQMAESIPEVYTAGKQAMVDELKLLPTTVSGSYISVDDVSELPHEVECKVESINLLQNKSETATLNGLSFTVNADKSITVTGTATEETVYAIGRQWLWTKGVYPDSFTISGTPSGYDGQLCIQVNWADVDSETELAKDTGDSASFEIPEIIIISTSIVVKSGTTLTDVTFYPMLNYGTTALPYTPYVSPESVKVTRTGANLFSADNKTFTGMYKYVFKKPLPPGEYVLSGIFTADTAVDYHWVRFMDANESEISTPRFTDTTERQTFRVSSSRECTHIYFYASTYAVNSAGITATLSEFMLNKGSTALPYEPYNGQTLTPDANGTVEGMTSASPYMNVFTDTKGVNIEAKYYKSFSSQTYYDEFWDNFQDYGNRTSCRGMFAGVGWNVNTFKPKYKTTPISNAAVYMFQFCNYGNTPLLDYRNYKNLFDFSSVTNAMQIFQDAWIDYINIDLSNATNLTNAFSEGYNAGKKTHITLTVSEKCTTFASAFAYCTALTDLIFTDGSVIAASINLKDSPLNKSSITSIINALSATATDKTVTFKKSAKEAAFTDEEWAELTATKPNWAFSLL